MLAMEKESNKVDGLNFKNMYVLIFLHKTLNLNN